MCPIVVEIDGNRPIRVSGNPDSPTYNGFCCNRGRALPEHIAHPERLLHSQKREADGHYEPILVEHAMDEIADRLSGLIEKYGPRSVALYIGTYAGPYPAGGVMAGCWLAMLGSPMRFVSATIDQPGKDVANAMLGRWLAGPQAFDDSDVWMIVGGNPIVTMAGGIPAQNPARRLKDRLDAGMQLIVIDPRQTETARRAQIHLQARPGEDAAILAAMIRVVLEEKLHDEAFVVDHVQGFAALQAAVAPFSPEFAAERAGIGADEIVRAARTFAGASRGLAVGFTGANMSGHSTLVEYLMLCLNTICGRFLREGEAVANPGVLLPEARPRAQAVGPRPYVGLGESLRVRGLTENASGMPTAALADEILLEGEGQVKALVCLGGNPMAAWPDQSRTARALEKLELLVQIDIKMSATASVADYVIAPKVSFEVPCMSLAAEQVESFSAYWGLAEPFGMYAPALVDPPEGSDLIEEWEFFYGLAQRMGVPLFAAGVPSTTATARADREVHPIDMENKPTTDEIFELLTRGSRIPLEEVKRHPNGASFDARICAEAPAPDCRERLDVGNPDMMRELGEFHERSPLVERSGTTYPYLLVSRRLGNVYNSSGRDIPSLTPRRGAYNPAFLHPTDLDELGVEAGAVVRLRSEHGEISAIVEPDPTLRRGTVSMPHAFGPTPGRSGLRDGGSNTSILVSVEDDFDAFSGIPRMSALPVAVVKG
jgi:anaerobic selenocysteine-containing dehydrogenase